MTTFVQYVTMLATISLVQLISAMSPGPSFLFVVNTVVHGSRREGIKVAAAMAFGAAVWAIVAIAGIDMLFVRFPRLYATFEFLGGAYLLWISYHIFIDAKKPLREKSVIADENAFYKSLLLQLSNPKVALFYSSLFVSLVPKEAPVWFYVIIVVSVFITEFVWFSFITFSLAIPRNFVLFTRFKPWIDRIVGMVLFLIGSRLLIGSL